MLIAVIFVWNGLSIFTSKVGQITNEPSFPGIKLILNLKGVCFFFFYLLLATYLSQMSTQWLKETKT